MKGRWSGENCILSLSLPLTHSFTLYTERISIQNETSRSICLTLTLSFHRKANIFRLADSLLPSNEHSNYHTRFDYYNIIIIIIIVALELDNASEFVQFRVDK